MGKDLGPVISALPEPERETLLRRGVPRRLAVGEFAHIAGDPCDRIHVVLDGVLKLSVGDEDGEAHVIGLAFPGDILGLVSLLRGEVHEDDATAATAASVLCVDGELLYAAARRHAPAAMALADACAERAAGAERMLTERTATVQARLASRLLEISVALGRMRSGVIEVELPLHQADLARLSGMCRESASKTLASFRREGLIDYRGRRLRIHRPDALERIRCAGRGEGPSPSRDEATPRRSR